MHFIVLNPIGAPQPFIYEFLNFYNLFCCSFYFFFRLAGIYEVLKDKEKRDIYDRVLVEGLPDWRSPAFYFRRMRKIGLVEALLYIFVLITVFQYFIHKAHHWEKKFTLKESEHIKIARKSTRKKQKAAGTHLANNRAVIQSSSNGQNGIYLKLPFLA